jgi:hypothetical protein
MVVESMRSAMRDPYRWKWAILAMQNEIQALIVTTISGTTGLGALKQAIAKKWIEAYEAGGANFLEEMKIDWFPELYAQMKREFSYVPDAGIDESVNRVNRLRNRFVNDPPQSWSLEAGGLPVIFKNLTQTPILGYS